MKQRFSLLLLACTISIGMWADLLNYPLDTINGKRYYRYTVEQRIGMYRIGKIFSVTQDQIVEANPQLNERGVQADEILLIPVANDVDFKGVAPKPVAPVVEDTVPVVSESVSPSEDTTRYRLDVILPFHQGLDKPTANENRILDFYRGIIMAMYCTQAFEGGQYDLYVHNSLSDTTAIAKLIHSGALEKSNGIIGPIYPEQVTYMSPWIKEHQIPTILPLDNHLACIADNPYLMQFNSTPVQEANAIVDYIESLDTPMHCVYVKTGETDESMEAIYQAIASHSISLSTITSAGALTDSLYKVLKNGSENLIFFSSDKYNKNKALITHLDTLGKTNISLLGTLSWQRYNLHIPLLYTTTFTTSMEADWTAYDMLWDKYFGFGHPSSYPRYDLLGYDIARRLITLLQQRDHKGLQSDIFFDTYQEGGGKINGHIEVIKVMP